MYFLARWFKYTSVLYLGLVYISLVACIVNGDSLLVKKSSVSYLQTQSVTVSSLQNNLGRSLQSRNIALDPSSSIEKYNKKTAVCESTIDKEIECRLSLTPAPIGSKCIAPCACSGSQRWVQFATINKLRRKEPSQWITCKVILMPFNYFPNCCKFP